MQEHSQPLSEDVDSEGTLRRNDQLQQVVDRLRERMEGAPVPDVARQLQRDLEAAGLSEQPEPWIDAAAREISAGRILVIDARHQVDPADLPER